MVKALGLFSGGLDSILAIKVLEEQNIKVLALSFVSPFFGDKEKLTKIAKDNNIDLKILDISTDYLKMLRSPKFGYGKNLNPCVDCKILMVKEAQEYAKKHGYAFVFTGEVVGQRPMSQVKHKLNLIKNQAGELLRPLSAKLLPETSFERNGLVDREKLFSINGRGRSGQFKLVKRYKVKEFSSPSGGCLLTEKGYCHKLQDFLNYTKNNNLNDIKLLKLGRHFRKDKNKFIVSRNEKENNEILNLKNKEEYIFQVQDQKGPIVLLLGKVTAKAINLAAQLAWSYAPKSVSDVVMYKNDKINKKIKVQKIEKEKFKTLMIT